MQYLKTAEEISAKLGLDSPPIALAFVRSCPNDIPVSEEQVPSACTYWRRAESRVFYAPAEHHFNCPIGSLTMGFEFSDEAKERLKEFVQKMCGCSYISEDEPAKIHGVEKEKAGIVYGPLRGFPLNPDLVLMWLTPSQAMLFGEAVGSSAWTSIVPTTAFGRPTCAALPLALNNSQSTLSLGCAGMRTFTDISNQLLLAVLPGARLDKFLEDLSSTLTANSEMGSFYREHRAQFV